MTEQAKSKYWLDQIADDIVQRYPHDPIIVSSGHSPSGTYHIGTLRELMTPSAIAWAIRQRGREAKHVDFVDDFDILRKIPAELPESFREELGKPLCLAGSPEDGVTYGEYFYRDLAAAAKAGGFAADETLFASDTYLQEHRYTEAIAKALAGTDRAREIIERVSKRKLPADYAPVQILSDDDRLNTWHYTGHDLERQMVMYKTEDGSEGEISFASGRVKLDWRLDWPARWWMWGVNVEPFGRDHAAKGGSYDTGRELVREIFGGEAPMPVPYEFILPAGQTAKFSKSAGGVLTPADALAIMPAEVLRYFVVRSRYDKQLIFDPGIPLANLIDEFAAAQADPNHPFKDAYRYAASGKTDKVISTVPFKHLVAVYQAARGDERQVFDLLERTGYKHQVDKEGKVILDEMEFIKNWLQNYAPDEVKFAVQDKLPEVELSEEQKQFLSDLAASIEAEKDIDGQRMHELIYAAKDKAGLSPQQGFQALYRVILDQDSGPKAGWFLASLDRAWLVSRLSLEK